MAKLIMIVDDSASLRQAVAITLKGAGYEVLEACDGRDALGKLNGRKVHLVISDIEMPNMDGITLVKMVKQLPQYRFIPIIVLTTESLETKKMEGKAAGVSAWLVKPFQPQALLSAVARLV
ncbi:MAG: response regulator [Gammaproteobacteria bacterium]|nr:response regulator [Gammaproteobacteria bacterium]